MWVRLLPPFGDGKTWHEINLPSGAGVKDLIDQLAKANPELCPYLRQTAEETFHQFILLRGDYVLKVEDTIEPDDRIVLLMPLTGG
jgi:hypothetical protein